jgi:hypothetical protein
LLFLSLELRDSGDRLFSELRSVCRNLALARSFRVRTAAIERRDELTETVNNPHPSTLPVQPESVCPVQDSAGRVAPASESTDN